MNKFTAILSQINESQDILVIGHVMPDGDDISSVTSLTLGLRQLGKNCFGSIDYTIPEYYKVFAGVSELRSYEDLCDLTPQLIIVVDSSSPDRVGRFQSMLPHHKTVVIDHHATNTLFGDTNWVDASYAATAQMVYTLNKALGVVYDSELATTNFVGIATDSGFFRFSNTDERVFKDAAELVRFGAQPYFVAATILENKRPEQMRLYCTMVSHMILEDSLVYSWLSYEDYLQNDCVEDDSTGFVGEMRSLKDIEVAILVTEFPKNEIHVSLRSKNWLDVSKIASILGGGGHARAAGCSFKGAELKNVLNEVVGLTKDFLQGGIK
ncbi:DHH family phosphoesterase [Thermotoga profunda]|uniref:DHH family phosphoesterase n=1 Tax=Thermotoga profunda TaxID=1508420 RepID=UPI0005974997|nr:bifunctional oligoribonuclease/PAP phosphatase NrnA [Thermotoga profunda]